MNSFFSTVSYYISDLKNIFIAIFFTLSSYHIYPQKIETSDLSKIKLGDVVEIENKTGINYSSNTLDIYNSMSKDGTFVKVPRDVIMELKYPNLDIKGLIK